MNVSIYVRVVKCKGLVILNVGEMLVRGDYIRGIVILCILVIILYLFVCGVG